MNGFFDKLNDDGKAAAAAEELRSKRKEIVADINAAIERMEGDDKHRGLLFDVLHSRSAELAEIRATLLLNFGKPDGEFQGGRLGQLVDASQSATAMFITIVQHFLKVEERDDAG